MLTCGMEDMRNAHIGYVYLDIIHLFPVLIWHYHHVMPSEFHLCISILKCKVGQIEGMLNYHPSVLDMHNFTKSKLENCLHKFMFFDVS